MSVKNLKGNTALSIKSGSLKGSNTTSSATTLLNDAVYYIDAKQGTNYIPTTASGYLYLPGVASNYASAPDSAALDITGDIDLRVKVALDNWRPSIVNTLVGKYTPSNRSYALSVNSDGTLSLVTTTNGTTLITNNSTVSTGIADGTTKWIRVTLDVDNGASGYDVKFYTSDDGSSWTQLGSTITGAGTTSIYSGAAVLEVGSKNAGAGDYARGKFFRAQVLNGIGGTTVFDANFETAMTSQTVASFTESSSNAATVTINRTTYNFQLDTIANLGSAGSLLPTTLGSSTASDTNDPAYLAHTGTNYVYLPGVASNYMSVPDATNLYISGDIDLRAQIALDNWIPSTNNSIISQDFGTNNYCYSFIVNTSGKLAFLFSVDGSTINTSSASTVAAGITNGTTKWVRVTRASSTGTIKYYTSDDGTTWTQLGTDTIATSGSLFNSTSNVYFGTSNSNHHLTGKHYRAQIYDGIAGTKVLDVDTSVITAGSATSFTAVTGQTVTINRATSGRKTVAVTQPTWLFGTDDYMEVNNRYMASGTYLYLPGLSGNNASTPSAAALNITGDIDLRAKIAMDDWTPAATNALMTKYGNAGNRSYAFSMTSTGRVRIEWSADGTNTIGINSTVSPTVNDGDTLWVRATLDVDNGASGNDVKFYTSSDGTTWTQLGTTVTTAGTTSIYSGTQQLEIGSFLTSNSIARGKFFRAQVRNGIDGTVAFDANFETSITSLLQTSFTESSVNAATVTINRSGSTFRSAGITGTAGYLYPGATNTFTASATSHLDFNASDEFTLLIAFRQWATITSGTVLLIKGRRSNSTTTTGQRYLIRNGTSNGAYVVFDDNTNVDAIESSVALTSGVTNTLGETVTTGTLQGVLNGISVPPSTRNAGNISTQAGENPFTIGGFAATYTDMEVYAVAVWRRRLLATELGTVYEYFKARSL